MVLVGHKMMADILQSAHFKLLTGFRFLIAYQILTLVIFGLGFFGGDGGRERGVGGIKLNRNKSPRH